ncbi:MAG: DUF998 domain-containing protein, partial [Oricola sp.]
MKAKAGDIGTNWSARSLVLFGPFAAVMFLAADRVGAAMTPGYSSWAQAISELMETGAPAKHVVDPLLIAYHGSVIPFAIGLHRATRSLARSWLAPALLSGAGLAGVILTAIFPCDPGCEPMVSLRGTLHILIAIPMGFSILVAIYLFSRRFRGSAGWRYCRIYSLLTFWSTLALAILTVAVAETVYVGVAERFLTYGYLQ